MSFKTIVTLLLLSCLSTTGTALGLAERPPQEEGVAAAVPEITPFIITDIRLDVTATNPTLQFCASDGLPSGSAQLNYAEVTPGSAQESVEGSIDVDKDTCVNFIMDPSFTLPDVLTRYELLLKDPVTSTVGRCLSTFAMTAKTTLLPCGLESFTKVTWGDPTAIAYTDCIAEDWALKAEAVCYHSGDIWKADFCFDIKDEEEATINICMNGLSSYSAAGGAVSAKYLYYGPNAINNGPGKATLSLAMVRADLTKLRAIVRRGDIDGPPGDPTVYSCSNNECTFNAYHRKYAKYEVCVEAMDDSKATQETATTTFTDMKLNAFDGGSQKSTLMEFVFANGLDGKTYSASYSLEPPAAGTPGEAQPNAVNVDCTSVAAGHACIGLLDIGTTTDTVVYLAVSDPTGINTIVTPYVVKVSQSLR